MEDGRLVFEDFTSFNAAISSLSKLQGQELEDFRLQFKNHTSLREQLEAQDFADADRRAGDDEYLMFPVWIQDVLNSHAEVKIADQIIWYSNGLQHAAKSEEELHAVKLDPSKSTKTAEYSIQVISSQENGVDPANNREVGHGTTANTYQHEFAYCADGSKRKYVHELISFIGDRFDSQGGQTYFVTLYFRCKLEYKGSNGWKLAGEYRTVSPNFVANVTNSDVRGVISQRTLNFPFPYSETRSQVDLVLCDEAAWKRFPGDGNSRYGWFNVTMLGSVEQAISSTRSTPGGAPCNPWGNLLSIQ